MHKYVYLEGVLQNIFLFSQVYSNSHCSSL